MSHSLRRRWWALLVPFCVACGRSQGELGPGDGTAGRTVANGGSPAASGGNPGDVAGAGSASAPGGRAAGGGGNAGNVAGAGGSPGDVAGAGGSPGDVAGAGGSPASGASSAGSALGGAAGDSDTGGTGGAPGDLLEPVRVIRGAADEYWDLTIRGEELAEYDGKRVLVRIGNPERPPERLGSGDALIESGLFELVFPAVWESDLYKTKLALVDVDGDRACDLSVDRLFQDSRASPTDELFVSTSPNGGRIYFTERDGVEAEYECGWFNREWPRE